MSQLPCVWTLVTGGAVRLGLEICISLAAQGHAILIHYNRSEAAAYAAVERCRSFGVAAECVQGDFSTPLTTAAFIDSLQLRFPNIGFLVNNVGNYQVQSALATGAQEWIELFQTNLHAPMELIRTLIPSIKKNQGAIINIGVVGIDHVPADTYSTAYTATKLSLWMATRALAKELAPSGVRVNMVSPGILENAVDMPSNRSAFPMHRPGMLSEVAHAVTFLLDKKSSYITGQNIEVAGAVRLQ